MIRASVESKELPVRKLVKNDARVEEKKIVIARERGIEKKMRKEKQPG